jgi:hypothetical protein
MGGVPDPPSSRPKASSWTKGLEQAHTFVDRLSASAFVAVVETSLVSMLLGLYLSLHPTTEGFRFFLLPAALVQAIFSSFLIFSKSRQRRTREATHAALSESLLAVAVLLNLLAVWIVWMLATRG